MNDQATIKYAGFWRRAFAYILDQILLNLIIFGAIFADYVIIRNFFAHEVMTTSLMTGEAVSETQPNGVGIVLIILLMIAVPVTVWLYFALFESSTKQATIGKMLLGIKVTDIQGKRIGFSRATGRHFAKIINGITFYIGFILAGFTEKKQALHDMIANTLVVRTK
jgi:uncharacterized RDD family membrane protein YckC